MKLLNDHEKNMARMLGLDARRTTEATKHADKECPEGSDFLHWHPVAETLPDYGIIVVGTATYDDMYAASQAGNQEAIRRMRINRERTWTGSWKGCLRTLGCIHTNPRVSKLSRV